jgi:tetratricopeptide (TPR) repeat protein
VSVTEVQTVQDLGRLLRDLRRRQARQRGEVGLTYRDLAARTGWSFTVIGAYFAGTVLPPTDRFDALVRLLGASPVEQGALATARDRVEESRRAARPDRPRPVVVPRQLPAGIRHFAGRAAELKALTGLLDQALAVSTTVISTIDGTAGIGKTALALHWAHLMADQFPDGQLYVDLRGFDPEGSPTDPSEVVRGFLDAFGVAPKRIPAGLDAQAGLYRSVLAGRRVLVVLDNAFSVEQVRPLLPGTADCLVLVTSRNRLVGLAAEGATALTLDVLSAAEARDLLAGHLGPERLAGNVATVREIVDQCAGLPLALAIVAARAAAHPSFSLAQLASELREARGSLDAFHAGDPTAGVSAAFSSSYCQLHQETARIFRLLGLHPGAEISVPAVASLAAVPMRLSRRALAELDRAHLISERSPGRFAVHDLLRAYAAELVDTHDSDAERRAAFTRVLDHYLHTAHAAARQLEPRRDPISPAPPQPDVVIEEVADLDAAMRWFTAEHPAVLDAVNRAAADGFDRHAWQLAWTLTTFFQRRVRWHDQVTAYTTALAATERLADRPAQAHVHRCLGLTLGRLDRFDEAHRHLRQAIDLYGQLRDPAGQAHTHLNIASILECQGRHADALQHAEPALTLYRAAGQAAGQARALNDIGWYYAQLGHHEQALVHCQQALTIHQQLDYRAGEADTWDSLGYANYQLGDHTRAATCYQRAAAIFRDLGDLAYEAGSLSRLGDTWLAAGDPRAASQVWQRALAIFTELDHPETGPLRARLRHLDTSDAASPAPAT